MANGKFETLRDGESSIFLEELRKAKVRKGNTEMKKKNPLASKGCTNPFIEFATFIVQVPIIFMGTAL